MTESATTIAQLATEYQMQPHQLIAFGGPIFDDIEAKDVTELSEGDETCLREALAIQIEMDRA